MVSMKVRIESHDIVQGVNGDKDRAMEVWICFL